MCARVPGVPSLGRGSCGGGELQLWMVARRRHDGGGAPMWKVLTGVLVDLL